MKKLVTVLVIVAILLVIFVLLGPFYIVSEGEQAVIVRFGRIERSVSDAGLHIKTPMVDNVVTYPKKILTWDGDQQQLPTKTNQFIWVDPTARWRITDPVRFYAAVNTLDQGYARLDDIIDSSVRTVIAKYDLEEAVRNTNFINERGTVEVLPSSGSEELPEGVETIDTSTVQRDFPVISKGRRQISQEILELSKPAVAEYGMEIIDIVLRQIRYSDELTESVENRMITERKQIAQQYRSLGEGAKQTWLGKLENERQAIMSRSYAESEAIKGQAEAEVTGVYAEAYNVDREFFDFWRAIESYRQTFPKFNKTLTTDMDYFKFMYDPDAD